MDSAKQEILQQLCKHNVTNAKDLRTIKAKIAKRYGIQMPTNASLLTEYKKLVAEGQISANSVITKLLQIRSVRTLSGIAPITVLTKPYQCPGRCIYCPT